MESSSDETIKIWDLTELCIICSLTCHRRLVNSIIELYDGVLASCSSDKTIKIWNMTTLTCKYSWEQHN